MSKKKKKLILIFEGLEQFLHGVLLVKTHNCIDKTKRRVIRPRIINSIEFMGRLAVRCKYQIMAIDK